MILIFNTIRELNKVSIQVGKLEIIGGEKIHTDEIYVRETYECTEAFKEEVWLNTTLLLFEGNK